MTTYTWVGNGSGSGNFSDSANWDPNSGPPASGDDASIGNGDTVTVDTASTASNLTIGTGAVVADGQTLTVDNALTIGASQNLIVNGDFSAGDTVFTSDYASYTGNFPIPGPGGYGVIAASNV